MSKAVVFVEKGWHLKEREPVKKKGAKLAVVDPSAVEIVKTAPPVMSPKTAAKLLDFSRESVAEWCRDGLIEAKKVRGEWRISRDALARFIIRESL